MTNYLTNQQYRQAKRRLTIAQKKGHEAVVREVARTFAEWDAGDYAYPDGWHRWNVAADDAARALERERLSGSWGVTL